MKKTLAKRISEILDRSADTTATVNKIIFGAQQLPKEMKK